MQAKVHSEADVSNRLSVGTGEERVNLEREALKNFPFCKKVLLFTSAFVYMACIGLSRFVLGAHTLDQVVFGWLIGIWLACTYAFIMREVIHHHIKDLTNLREKCKIMTHFWAALGIYTIVMGILVITFYITRNMPLEYPPSDNYGIIPEDAASYYISTLSDSSWLISGLGAYAGILF